MCFCMSLHETCVATSLITLGVKVVSSQLPAHDAPNCADDVLRTRLTVLQLERSSADMALAFLQ